MVGAPPRRIERIFIGADGLRAGWSLAIYYALAAVAIVAYIVFVPHAAAAPDTAESAIAGLAPSAIGLAVLAFIMSRIERRPFGAYGLKAAHAVTDFALGLGGGIAMMALLIGALWLVGALAFGPVDTAQAWRSGGTWLITFLLVGFVEEFWFRGYFQFTLARGLAGFARWARPSLRCSRAIGFWSAAAIFSGLFFVLGHLATKGETGFGLASVALAGLTFAYGLYRSGALWWGIGFHAAWDWSETFLFGAADSGHAAQGHLFAVKPMGPVLLSGGSAGPEGSILILPTLALMALMIHRLYRRRPTLGLETVS